MKIFKALRILHQDMGWVQCDEEQLDVVISSEPSERIKVLEDALPPPERLELLAEWFDKCYYNPSCSGETKVQDDLRLWAKRIRAALEVKK
jgi:hypothetical protein